MYKNKITENKRKTCLGFVCGISALRGPIFKVLGIQQNTILDTGDPKTSRNALSGNKKSACGSYDRSKKACMDPRPDTRTPLIHSVSSSKYVGFQSREKWPYRWREMTPTLRKKTANHRFLHVPIFCLYPLWCGLINTVNSIASLVELDLFYSLISFCCRGSGGLV